MIVDAHTHIFFPEVRRDRSEYMAGEEAFADLYRDARAKLVSAEQLLEAMDENGVDRSVVFGFPWKDPSTASMHNDYVLEAVQRHPDRLIGFACVHPGVKGAVEELDRCLRAGMKGVGELAFYADRITADGLRDTMKPMLDVCRDHDVPLLLHANETVGHAYPGKTPLELGELYRFVKDFAPQPIILAHWGGGLFFYELMKKEVRDALRHVCYDTAASPYLYRPRVYTLAAELCGPERILFGSDYPLAVPSRYFEEMEQAGLDSRARSLICGENALRLLGM